MPEVQATWVDEARDTYHLRVVHNLFSSRKPNCRIRSFVSSAQHAPRLRSTSDRSSESLRV
ncbi:MAG: hypothetical protein R2710_27935 [Acidimicrobiales bacterium]